MAVSAACFNPTYDNPACGPNGECPSGFTCEQDVCRSGGTDIDAPSEPGDDATDAPSEPTDAPTDGISGVCGTELFCPQPSGSRTTICGRIWDTEADQPIAAEGADPTAPCGVPTTSGPCSLRVRFYDAFAYANDPVNATPLMPAAALVDGCGRFRAQDIPNPAIGVIAVAIDDSPGIGPQTPHRLTGITVRSNPMAVEQTRAFATRVSTDTLWSSTAGLPSPTFADRGVALFIFRYANTPRTGVMVRRAGTIIPSDDYYFSNPGPGRVNVSPVDNVTGPNGSALVTGGGSRNLMSYDGQGNEPPGCTWGSTTAAAIPGSVLVQFLDAVDPAGNPCP
jgi:hypothetical protein